MPPDLTIMPAVFIVFTPETAGFVSFPTKEIEVEASWQEMAGVSCC